MGAEPLAADDLALLKRLADRVVELRLETPAILTLETALPLSVVAGQAMLFFEPFAQMLFPVGDYRRWASLIERRDALAALTRLIEDGADAREEASRPKKPS